jgi:hypothetical protein
MIGIAWFLYSEMRIHPMQLDGHFGGQVAAAKPQTRRRRRRSLLWMTASRLLAAAVASFLAAASASSATAGAMAAEATTVPSPICNAADVRLVTLIEAHGEAQDVPAEILAQAFFTVLEARKACNQGQVEAAMKLYDSISLRPVTSEGE